MFLCNSVYGVAFGVNVEAHVAGSKDNDNYNSHTNALITAGDILYTHSGCDTNIAGAHLEGDSLLRIQKGCRKPCINLIHRYITIKQIWITFMRNDIAYRCRICGHKDSMPPWGENGDLPSFNICECCGVEYGYEDATATSIIKYRDKWIQNGAKWFCPEQRPSMWDLEEQLSTLSKEPE